MNEITVTNNLSVANGFLNLERLVDTKINQAGEHMHHNVHRISIGTPTHIIINPDITTTGRVQIRNLDTTNYVTYDYLLLDEYNAEFPYKLKPGETASFRFNSWVVSFYALAHTAPLDLEVLILED